MIATADIHQAKLLIVDDQEANVILLEQMLRGAGYRSIATTQNPHEVRELYHQHQYDLILLDLQMPGLDGFQVMEGLKKIETSGYLPVLVITAQPDHKLRALQAGARDFISKPFILSEVLLRVHNMLEVRLLHRESRALCAQIAVEQAAATQLLKVFRSGPFAMSISTVDGTRLLDANEQYCRFFGYARDEIVGQSIRDLGLWADPEDRVLAMERLAQEGVMRGFEARQRRKSGEVRDTLISLELIELAGGHEPVLIAMFIDITERKQAEAALRESEERFKFVARAVSDVVWDWDLAANTLWWNDGFLTTFGFVAGEIAPCVESWISRIHPEERSRVVDSIHEAISAGAEIWNAEYRFQRKDGSHAFVQDRGFILRDPAGKGIRMVGGIRDLTEQKKIEAQYLRAQRMDSIGTLAGGIAHDLNNVLAPIMMSIELLKLDAGNDPRRIKTLNSIHTSCSRGSDLVKQILSFARGIDGQRVAMRLRHLINDLEGIISETFPRNIQIISDVSADLWPITGDPTQLHQILLNLAVNARDAMPNGGTLTLTATNLTVDAQFAGMSPGAKAGPHVLLQVIDTGDGIPLEVRDRIFEPFFTTKEIGKGTGIGLATVHTVVKNHGGFLNVESEVGQGSTFKICLPADPALRTVASVHPFPPVLPRGQNELVLVVDDEPSIRDITRQTLEAFGYRVVTAGDGAEALALYTQHASEIALVLTDMMMPVMDGAATIQVLMRINPAIKIIAASGINSGDNITRASKAGVKHFLSKPYTAETLLKLCRDVLDRPTSLAAG
jgi:PAS domain S-box-containing protein